MFFSVITKNFNWEILTKDLVFLKDGMGLRIKNFNIMGVHWKIQFLEGGARKSNIGGNCLKMGAWTVWRFKRGLGEKEGGVFKGDWYPNVHYGDFLEIS